MTPPAGSDFLFECDGVVAPASFAAKYDLYVPITVEKATPSQRASIFFTVGHASASKVDVAVDPESRTINGFSLVWGDKSGKIIDETGLEVVNGLPTVTLPSGDSRYHENFVRSVKIGVSGRTATMDWSDGEPIDTVIQCNRFGFYTGAGRLLGVSVKHIGIGDLSILKEHFGKN